uniref:Ground-like domain-containing protein n=1 Tax=Caenorhabditis tropicalis TaxID=1561998 RepID=A0A1I7UQF4_9PELO
MTSSILLRVILTLILLISSSPAQRSRRKQKFVRLPSGFTFPADAASNFQRDSYIPATVGNSDSHGMNYAEYKKAIQSYTAPPYQSSKTSDSYPASPPPPSPPPTIPPVTVVESPGMPPEVTTIAPGPTSTAATVGLKKENIGGIAQNLNSRFSSLSPESQQAQRGHTYTALGGGQFYQSLLGGKGGFSPLSFFLNQGLGGGGGGGHNNGFFVPVPVVIPPPPPPPPGPKCFTNPSGFLCCNVTLEKTMEEAYIAAKADGASTCNVQKMATAVQAQAEKKFGTTFESVAAHKDFVAKINFAGDLNCKIEIDGKFIMAYATPLAEQEVNIVDASSFFSGAADQDLDGVNGTKPTYIVYGPIK